MIYEFIKIEDSDTKKSDLKLVKPKDLLNLKLYFVSERKDFEKLSPRIPKNDLTMNDFENNNIPRVCFAPSIQQCLQAISYSIEASDTKEYYVYVPKDNLFKHKIYKCVPKDVPDANLTDEYWCLDAIKIQPLYKIKIGKLIQTASFKYSDVYNYKIIEAYETVNTNVLQEYAEFKEVKYIKAEQNDISMWLEFKDYKEARSFFTKCKHDLSAPFLTWVDNKVYYNIG